MPLPGSSREYYAVAGSHLSNKDAEIIGPELDRLRDAKGDGLDALDVLDAAKDKKSPLHPFITWDKNLAAVQWNMNEARKLINSVRVRETTGDQTEDRPLFIADVTRREDNVKPAAGREFHLAIYDRPAIIASDMDRAEAAVKAAARYLLGAKKRLQEMEEMMLGRYPSLRKVLDGLEEFEREAA